MSLLFLEHMFAVIVAREALGSTPSGDCFVPAMTEDIWLGIRYGGKGNAREDQKDSIMGKEKFSMI